MTKRQLGVLAQLRIQVSQDLWESVFGVLAQGMVVKQLPGYGEWFEKRMEWFLWRKLHFCDVPWVMCPPQLGQFLVLWSSSGYVDRFFLILK